MEYFLYGLFFLSCIVLILVVLLQPGKTDAGALFTSNVSSNAFGPRGTATVLSKATIVAATVFMLSALMLSMPGLTGNVSVLSTNPETSTQAPAANTDANTNVDANAANSAVTVPPITNVTTNTTTANTNPAANTAKTNTAANANK